MRQSNIRFTPVFILSATAVIAMIFVAIIIFIAVNTPWLGLELRANTEHNHIEIIGVAPDGPAGGLEQVGILKSISSAGNETVKLQAQDLIEEPDTIATFVEMYVFLDRQHALALILQHDSVEIEVEDAAGNVTKHEIKPAALRPFQDMPLFFLAQLLVATAGFLIGSWVFLLRPDWPSAFFAVVGVGLAMASGSAAIYSVRELAIDGVLFDILSRINHFGGTMIFGFGMIALFLIYPRKLLSKKNLFILLAMDAVLILFLAFDDLSAFSLSVLSVGLLYLPFRDYLRRLFMRRKTANSQDIFNELVDIAYVVSLEKQQMKWQNLMQRLFNPLVNEFYEEKIEQAVMISDGLEIRIPAVPPIDALKLEYAHSGRKLFTRGDVARAQEMVAMFSHVMEDRNAHEKGVREERHRIARDMHDNIGAQLLSALHSDKARVKM